MALGFVDTRSGFPTPLLTLGKIALILKAHVVLLRLRLVVSFDVLLNVVNRLLLSPEKKNLSPSPSPPPKKNLIPSPSPKFEKDLIPSPSPFLSPGKS